jgi:hypothetical protein
MFNKIWRENYKTAFRTASENRGYRLKKRLKVVGVFQQQQIKMIE